MLAVLHGVSYLLDDTLYLLDVFEYAEVLLVEQLKFLVDVLPEGTVLYILVVFVEALYNVLKVEGFFGS